MDCGAHARGGLQAGLGFAAACMGGLGRLDPVPGPVGDRIWPGVGVAVDEPAAACLAAQYAGWKLEAEGSSRWPAARGAHWRAPRTCSRSWPGDERADRAVLCLETRQDPPAEIVDKVAERCGVQPAAITFLIAPTASVCGSVQISARVVETALHKLHELGVDPARVRSGWGCCPIAPVAADDPAAIGRTNDAVLYGGTVHLWIEADDEETADLAQRLPSVASEAFGTPFGELLAAADGNFYDIDPMLFSPAAVTLTSTESGRAHHGGGLAPACSSARSPRERARLRVGVLGASGSWHSRGLIGALTRRGHEALAIPATRLQSVVSGVATCTSSAPTAGPGRARPADRPRASARLARRR